MITCDAVKPDYREVLSELGLPQRLSAYDAVVIGTPPLGIDVESSDIDLACSAGDLGDFLQQVEELFGDRDGYISKSRDVRGVPAAIASFAVGGWIVEIFCQALPVRGQWGVRHFRIEKRLLELVPGLRPIIRELKRCGTGTEPAFAQALGLSGDPYEALLLLDSEDDDALAALAAKAGP